MFAVQFDLIDQVFFSVVGGWTAFIGFEDSVYCGFSSGDTCQWEVQGDILNVSSLSPPFPTIDGIGDPVGCFVAGNVPNGEEQSLILAYSAFSYVCGFSFFFQVYDNIRLLLQTSNGTTLWASNTADVTKWEFVEYSSGQFPFTVTTEQLVFVAEKMGVLSSFSYAAVDEVILDFCLPCELSLLSPGNQITSMCCCIALYVKATFVLCKFHTLSDSFSLTVPNYLTVYLREEQAIAIKVHVELL